MSHVSEYVSRESRTKTFSKRRRRAAKDLWEGGRRSLWREVGEQAHWRLEWDRSQDADASCCLQRHALQQRALEVHGGPDRLQRVQQDGDGSNFTASVHGEDGCGLLQLAQERKVDHGRLQKTRLSYTRLGCTGRILTAKAQGGQSVQHQRFNEPVDEGVPGHVCGDAREGP